MFKLLSSALNIFGGLFSWLNKKADVDLEKYKVKGTVDVAAMQADVSVIQARADLAKAMKDDPTTKWGRILFIYPTGIWFSLIIWDSIARENALLGDYTWRVLALPNNLDYIPYAVVAYLLVTAWRK